jgi:cell wall-associated NlpC family hydrolase
VRLLRPMRLLVPAMAVFAALALVLVVGLIAFTVNGGGARSTGQYGACDAGLRGGVTLAGGAGGTTAATLSDEQRTNAATIIGVARGMGAPPRAWLVALATAMQESTLRNIDYGDRDSLGLFQQRPSQGWGSPAQVTDPVYSTTIFIERLLEVPGWDTMPVTVAAQTVQRSAFPNAYAKWENLAAELVQGLADVADPIGCRPTAVLADGVAGTAIAFALAEVGSPYLWGGNGPDRWDCSGLLVAAFREAGITLPRVSRDQYHAGGHLPVREMQPGDLLFYGTDPSDPRTIHHVAMYIGDDQMVEAPYTGEFVRVRPVPWEYAELLPLATRPGTAANRA